MVSVNVNTAAAGKLSSLFSSPKQNEVLGLKAASLHFVMLRSLVTHFSALSYQLFCFSLVTRTVFANSQVSAFIGCGAPIEGTYITS